MPDKPRRQDVVPTTLADLSRRELAALRKDARQVLDRIEELQRQAGRTFLELGRLLLHVRDNPLVLELLECETFDVFLERYCRLGRTQAFKIMRVTESFGREPSWERYGLTKLGLLVEYVRLTPAQDIPADAERLRLPVFDTKGRRAATRSFAEISVGEFRSTVQTLREKKRLESFTSAHKALRTRLSKAAGDDAVVSLVPRAAGLEASRLRIDVPVGEARALLANLLAVLDESSPG